MYIENTVQVQLCGKLIACDNDLTVVIPGHRLEFWVYIVHSSSPTSVLTNVTCAYAKLLCVSERSTVYLIALS